MRLGSLLPLAPLLLLAGFWTMASGVVSRETSGPQNRLEVRSSTAAQRLVAAPQTEAQCAAVAADVQSALGEMGDVVVSAPFVIGGDSPRAELQRWRDAVVLPAAGALAANYFPAPITRPIVILLFSDRDSYRAACRSSFQADALPCDGFFDADKGMIVIDTTAGEGTLVHELTHAMMHDQMRRSPQWFNEGLASLNEHVQIVDGASGPMLRPFDNWRLGVLREAAAQQKMPRLRDMIEGNDFHAGDLTINYALARSFCHFLHDHDQLTTVFDRIRTNVDGDPSGSLAVQAAFRDQSWTQIEDRFQIWLDKRAAY